jgi:hypothetical protein
MSYTPDFMKRFEEFDRERDAIRTEADWTAFVARWFDQTQWPLKPPETLNKEGLQKAAVPKVQEGRRWAPVFTHFDLTPEARYEYFWTINTVGNRFKFPQLKEEHRTAMGAWVKECGFCEISTAEPGSDKCPQCRRPLYDVWAPD